MTTHNRDQPGPAEDQQLLQQIDRLLSGAAEAGDRQLPEAYRVLAGVIPQSTPAFQQQLKAQLLARREAQSSRAGERQGRPRWLPPGLPRPGAAATASEARRPLRSARRIGVMLAVIVICFGFVPSVRTGAVAAVSHVIEVLVNGIFGAQEPAQPDLALPFAVQQPAYLPPGMRGVAQRSAPAGGQTPATPRAEMLAGDPFEAIAQLDSEQAFMALAYQGTRTGQLAVLFERAARPGEQLPDGEQTTVAGQPARLQRLQNGIRLTWISQGTWIELSGTIEEAELLKMAQSFKVTHQAAQPEAAARSDTDQTFGEIPRLNDLEAARRQAGWDFPAPGWLPPELQFTTAHIMDGWILLVYHPTIPDPTYEYAAVTVNIITREGLQFNDQHGVTFDQQEPVQITGHPATFESTADGHVIRVVWQVDQTLYIVRSDDSRVRREELLRIAESLQK